MPIDPLYGLPAIALKVFGLRDALSLPDEGHLFSTDGLEFIARAAANLLGRWRTRGVDIGRLG